MIRLFVGLALSLGALFSPTAGGAHEVRPAYLEIREVEPGRFAVAWKQPIKDGRRLKIDPVLPSECAESPRRRERVDGALITRWTAQCALSSGTLELPGLERTLTDALLRVSRLDGGEATVILRPEAPRHAFGAETPGAAAYLWIGVEHILFGPDHLLFVVGLVLVAERRQLLGAITAFTLAHSITLALSALGGLSLPGPPVEIAIALSIALLGYEATLKHRGRRTFTIAAPWAAAFLFGLAHGLGFAGALAEIGLPQGAQAPALLLFNLGVELGQIAALLVLLAAFAAFARLRVESGARIIAAYALGVAGFIWVFERIAAAFA